MKTGKIVITDKVYFEPDGLPKPSKAIYYRAKLYHFENLIIQKYKASKQLIEVENVVLGKYTKRWRWFNEDEIGAIIINNQPCKAKIENGKAIIISLTKK